MQLPGKVKHASGGLLQAVGAPPTQLPDPSQVEPTVHTLRPQAMPAAALPQLSPGRQT